jgi:HPt (histidine-containing phosphotransfer) domain-containing protein
MSENEDAVARKIQAMLEVMWKNNAGIIAERLELLRNAREKLIHGTLTPAERKSAESAAHKLSGILGTFGLPEGSSLASKMERLLAKEGAIDHKHRQEFGVWLDGLESQVRSKDR